VTTNKLDKHCDLYVVVDCCLLHIPGVTGQWTTCTSGSSTM